MNKIIGKRIKKAREKTKLKQQDLANHLGHKTSASISEIERGKVHISGNDLFKLANLLNKPIEYFYGIDNEEEEFFEDLKALIRKMPKEAQEPFKQLANGTRDIQIISEALKTTPQNERQIELMRDFHQKVLNYLIPLNTMRNQGLEIKSTIEKALGFDE